MYNKQGTTPHNIIGREEQGLARTIKESIYIRVNNPTGNQNVGKYHLSYIWDRVLLRPQGLNWALPNSQLHKQNLGSMSHLNINVSNSHVHKHNLGSVLIYPIINVLEQP